MWCSDFPSPHPHHTASPSLGPAIDSVCTCHSGWTVRTLSLPSTVWNLRDEAFQPSFSCGATGAQLPRCLLPAPELSFVPLSYVP